MDRAPTGEPNDGETRKRLRERPDQPRRGFGWQQGRVVSSLFAVFLPLLVGYATVFRWVWDSWVMPESYYSHGPIVLVAAVVLVWVRRADWHAAPARPDGTGWLLLAPGLCIHACGAALTIDSLSAASLCLSIPGAVLLGLGRARWRALLPILWLPVFAVPMPMFVTGTLAFELKEFAIGAGLELARLGGVDAVRVGAEIAVGAEAQRLQVADPCSGLRSLVSLTTLGYCIAFFLGPQRGARRWILLGAAVPIAILSNVVRIAVICWMASEWGTGFATGTGHDILGYAVWGFDLAVLLLIDLWLSRRMRRRG
jgi:exosortase